MGTTVDLAPATTPPAFRTGTLTFIGTATVLLHYGGFTVLTDPNFLHAGDHAHLGYGMRSPRLTDPALEIDELPPLDACLLSHLHGDHWDEVATARLPKDLPIVTTPHAARQLEKRGFHRTLPVRRWETASFRRGEAWLRVTAMPGRHGPPVFSALLPPVMGSMLELGGAAPAGARDGAAERPRAEIAYRLYVSGDTLVHADLRRIPERYPHVDLGLFHLGGTRVLGVLVTMDAEQGVQAIRIVRPDVAVPIHYDDYEVFRSPLQDFVDAVDRAGLSRQVRYLGRGERYEFDVRRVSREGGEERQVARAEGAPGEPPPPPGIG